jgi:hypothetical protein
MLIRIPRQNILSDFLLAKRQRILPAWKFGSSIVSGRVEPTETGDLSGGREMQSGGVGCGSGGGRSRTKPAKRRKAATEIPFVDYAGSITARRRVCPAGRVARRAGRAALSEKMRPRGLHGARGSPRPPNSPLQPLAQGAAIPQPSPTGWGSVPGMPLRPKGPRSPGRVVASFHSSHHSRSARTGTQSSRTTAPSER